MNTYNRFKLIKGGAGAMEAIIHNGAMTTNSAEIENKKSKTDWDELTDICYSSAQKTGLTYEQVQRTLKSVRRRLNAGCR